VSQENVEIVHRWAWAFEHDADTFVELTHPEIEWAPFEENHTWFRGVEAAKRIRDGWLDAWAEHRLEIEETLDAGDDLLSIGHIEGRGRGSGAQVDVRLYLHMKVRDGKVVYVFEYQDRAEALKAVGLEE